MARTKKPNRVEIIPDGSAYLWFTDRSGAEVGTIRVDQADLAILSVCRWGCDSKGYAQARNGGKIIRMHRFLLGSKIRGAAKSTGQKSSSLDVDHINENKLDNRRINLRILTRSSHVRSHVQATEEDSVRRAFKSYDFTADTVLQVSAAGRSLSGWSEKSADTAAVGAEISEGNLNREVLQHLLRVRVDADLIAKLKKTANKQSKSTADRVSVSDIVRAACENYLAVYYNRKK